MKISKINQEILETINGTEFQSKKYKSCVGISGNKIIDAGKVVDILDSNVKINRVFKEIMKNEGL
jgi:hypothetical protein